MRKIFSKILCSALVVTAIVSLSSIPALASNVQTTEKGFIPSANSTFNLFLGESFYSAHYGTEITFSTQSSNSKIDNIINSLLSQDIAVIYPLDE